MAKPIRIVVHCTGEPAESVRSREYYRHLFFDVYKWHHWGYHCLVYQDGTWEHLQPLPKVMPNGANIDYNTKANGAKGYNNDSLHIAYVGGLNQYSFRPADTRTPEQKATLRVLIAEWKRIYGIKTVLGHCDLDGVTKFCPCFNAEIEYRYV